MSVRGRVRGASRSGVGLVLAAAMLAACGSSVPSPIPSSALIPVPTQAPPPGGQQQACMAALLTGVLAADQRWGVVVAQPGGEPAVKVIWPFGYAGLLDASGIVLVDLSANGAVVGRVGDRVEVGGGFLSGVDNAWFACGGVKVVPSR